MTFEQPWFLYVVECSDGSLYTGITTDVKRRIYEHNNSKRAAKYTRSRRPVELIFWCDYNSKSEALKAEYTFKQLSAMEKRLLLKSLEPDLRKLLSKEIE